MSRRFLIWSYAESDTITLPGTANDSIRGGDVHGFADEPLGLDDHLAQMDADPDGHVLGAELPLHPDGASHRIDRVREHAQAAVPSRWTIVPPPASWFASSAAAYRFRLSIAGRSSICMSAVYPTMSVNITATSRRSRPLLTLDAPPLGQGVSTGPTGHGEEKTRAASRLQSNAPASWKPRRDTVQIPLPALEEESISAPVRVAAPAERFATGLRPIRSSRIAVTA